MVLVQLVDWKLCFFWWGMVLHHWLRRLRSILLLLKSHSLAQMSRSPIWMRPRTIAWTRNWWCWPRKWAKSWRPKDTQHHFSMLSPSSPCARFSFPAPSQSASSSKRPSVPSGKGWMSLEIRNWQAEAVLYFFEVAGGWLKRRVRWSDGTDSWINSEMQLQPPGLISMARHGITWPRGCQWVVKKTFRSRFELWQVVMTVSDEKHISKQIWAVADASSICHSSDSFFYGWR